MHHSQAGALFSNPPHTPHCLKVHHSHAGSLPTLVFLAPSHQPAYTQNGHGAHTTGGSHELPGTSVNSSGAPAHSAQCTTPKQERCFQTRLTPLHAWKCTTPTPERPRTPRSAPLPSRSAVFKPPSHPSLPESAPLPRGEPPDTCVLSTLPSASLYTKWPRGPHDGRLPRTPGNFREL